MCLKLDLTGWGGGGGQSSQASALSSRYGAPVPEVGVPGGAAALLRPRRHLGGGGAWAVQAELKRGARLEDTFRSRERWVIFTAQEEMRSPAGNDEGPERGGLLGQNLGAQLLSTLTPSHPHLLSPGPAGSLSQILDWMDGPLANIQPYSPGPSGPRRKLIKAT